MKDFEELLKIARRKNTFDETNPWSNGSETYLKEIRKELIEVEEELNQNRICYLEDELGDVLWDYLNILLALEKEEGISAESVFRRARDKYDQRISGIEKGVSWSEIKTEQKKRLSWEHRETMEAAGVKK